MINGIWKATIRRASIVLFIGLFFGVLSVGMAQEGARGPWVTDTINSHALGRRVIRIALPDDYGVSTSRYPVLVVLDAQDVMEFRLFIAQADYLADNIPGFPTCIVVGVVSDVDRIRDMVPKAQGSSVKGFPTAGGDEAFADFITGEMLPRVRTMYRTLPSTILAGHSAGGLFVLGIAANRPEAFQGIIAMSPSLWYNDSMFVKIYSDKIGTEEHPPRLFVSNGGLEKDIDNTTRHFVQLLDSMGTLKGSFEHRRYPDLIHPLTPMSFGDGLRFMFDPVSSSHLAIEHLDYATVDSAALIDSLRASERAYAPVARSLGLPGQLPEGMINTLAYRLLHRKKPDLALPIFARNVQSYPQSWNVYDSYGEALLAKGDTAAAIANYRKSLALNPGNSNAVKVLSRLSKSDKH